jgi:hypothetical protein
MSKECPNRKHKEGSKSGKYKGKYKKGKRFAKGHHIQATEVDGESNSEEEVVKESSQSSEEKTIHASLKKIPKEQQINMLLEQDFC